VEEVGVGMLRIRTGFGAASIWAIASAIPAAAAAPEVHFAPHRAVYEFTLARTGAGSGVSEMTGRMVYELTGSACEGFAQNMRFVTRTTNQDGSSQLNDLRSSSWEDLGRKLRFSSSQYRDDRLTEATQGDAARPDETATAAVELTRPAPKKIQLGAGVYFPIQHSAALIRAARAGQVVFKAELYDGSEKGEKVYATSAIIGRELKPGAKAMPASVKNGEKLDALSSWPISISYFEPGSDKKDALPAYELAFRFYENGVSTKLAIDYGDFAITGELKELTFHEPGKCPATAR
jgi:hypothetical protein